ncbi:Vsp/OspC family lipoprotein [Borrelia crocidurae]|nr:Vsp/OspC family lipoprotein [Borrelia crocidurae]
MKREKEVEGKGRVKVVMIMVMMVVMMGCNSGGGIKEGEEGKARKGDGSVIDLKVVSKKIRDASEFMASVKEIETLVKSIDELVKAIGKKIDANGLADDANHNGSLIAGAYSVIVAVDTKLGVLETKAAGLSNDLKAKVTAAKVESTAFLTKIKGQNSDLGKDTASDAHVKNAIDKNDGTGGKGKEELVKLNTAVNELLKAANTAVGSAITELTSSEKAASA